MRALLAQAKADGPALLLLAIVVAAASLIASLVPRLINTMEQAALAEAAAAAPVNQREIRATWDGWVWDQPSNSGTTAADLAGTSDRIAATFRPPLSTAVELPMTITMPAICAAPMDLPRACLDGIQWREFRDGLEFVPQGNTALDQIVTWDAGRAPTAQVGEAELEQLTQEILDWAPGQWGTIEWTPEMRARLDSGEVVFDETVGAYVVVGSQHLEPVAVPQIEAALPTEVAQAYGISVGDEFSLESAVVTITGLFSPAPGSQDAWTGVRPLSNIRWEAAGTDLIPRAEQAVLFVDPDVLWRLPQHGPSNVVWRIPVDVTAATPGQVAALASALTATTNARVFASDSAVASGPGPAWGSLTNPVSIRTGVSELLAAYQSQVATFRTLGVVVYLGLAAIAAAVIVMATEQLQARRAGATALARARGMSLTQVWGATLPVAAVVIALGALLGWAIGAVLANTVGLGLDAGDATSLRRLSNPGDLTPLLVAAIFALALGSVAVATAIGYRRANRAQPIRARPAWRITVELAVLLLAGLAAFLLQRRGLAAGGQVGVDPFLALVPVLLALAGAVLALRLGPLPTALAARAARSGRGAPTFVGLTSARGTSAFSSAATLVVLVVAVAFCVLVSAVANTIGVGQQRSSWDAAGADVTVSGTTISPDVFAQVETTPGVLAVVPAVFVAQAEYGLIGGTARWNTAVLALDAQAYQAARAERAALPGGAGADADLTDLDLLAPSGNWSVEALETPGLSPVEITNSTAGGFETPLRGSATAQQSTPALSSLGDTGLPTGPPGELSVTDPGAQLRVQISEASPVVPTAILQQFGITDPDTPLLLVPLDALDQAASEPLAPNMLLVYTDNDGTAQTLAADLGPDGGLHVGLRTALIDDLQTSPLVAGARVLVTVAVFAAGALGMLAVALGLLAGAPNRTRSLSVLRTLGMPPRSARLLLVAELAPLVVIALATGVGVGLALLPLLTTPLDLRPYTGGSIAPTLTAVPAQVLAIVGATTAVVALAVLAAVLFDRRRHLGTTLRVGGTP